mgnify:CR=1 FL=1
MSHDFNKIINEYDKDNFDFGFSTTSELEFTSSHDLEIAEYKTKLENVEKLIMPLLVNLNKNLESDIIKWPNRGPVIEQKIKELLKITRGN